MHNNSRRKAAAPGYASRPATRAPGWHGLVILDVLFNNLTTGLFLAAALSELAAPRAFAAVAAAAYPIALLFLVIDLSLLVLDLGDPLRFHHMLRVFKPSSPMSLGTWCLTACSLPLSAAAAISLLPVAWAPPEWVRQVVVAVGLLPALGSAVYKGVLFSTSAQPGWKDARWLGAYLTNSALMLGCSQLLGLSVLLGQPGTADALRPALVLLLLLNAAALALLANDLRAALSKARGRAALAWLGALTMGAGLLLSLILLLAGGALPILAAALLVVLGAALVRRELVRLPHASEAFQSAG
jgi:hypothetical protein